MPPLLNIFFLFMYSKSLSSVTSKQPLITNPLPTVGGVCNFLSSVSLQQKFEATDQRSSPSDGPVLQLCATAQFYLENKGKHVLRACRPQSREEKRGPPAWLWLLFLRVFPPPPEPALCKLGQPGAQFVLSEVLTPVLGPSFVLFLWSFPLSCLLATTILDSFFLF